MSLSYWIETMMTLSSPAGARSPGTLARQVGVEYLFPLVPPNIATFFTTTPIVSPSARGFPIYMAVMFKIIFGHMVPGAFQLTMVAGGLTAYDGTITDRLLEQGIDYIYFLEPDSSSIVYVTNLTPLNQYFEMVSQYLVISSEGDYRGFKKQLEKLQYPYALPEVR